MDHCDDIAAPAWAAPGSGNPRRLRTNLRAGQYEWLRLYAFTRRQTLSGVLADTLAAYRGNVEAGLVAVVRPPDEDMAGALASIMVFLDDDLYEWLRLRAFRARMPINAVAIAAVVHVRTICALDAAGNDGGPDLTGGATGRTRYLAPRQEQRGRPRRR